MTTQNTPPSPDYEFINCKGHLVDLRTPRVMGIINTTPNSFYKGSRFQEKDAVLSQVQQFLAEGADFIDIGGHSTKPGADWVPEDEERNRTIPFIEAIKERFPEACISIDTFRSTIAEEAIEAGAAIINDVSGGNLDEGMFDTVAKLQVPYILMHMQGTPQTMQQNPTYEDVTQEIITELSGKIEDLKKRHVPDVIVDPGFGFGKTLGHNYQLLRQLHVFRELGLPLLVGLSRKSMIKKTLNIPAEEGGNATTVLNTLALQQGAQVLRVHDVKPAVEAVTLWQHYQATPVDEPVSAANC
jgi:dihydropteroate synthase